MAKIFKKDHQGYRITRTLIHPSKNAKGYSHFGKVSFLKIKHKVSIKLRNSTRRQSPKRNESMSSHKNSHMKLVHSHFILNSPQQKQPKRPLSGERIKKSWYIHTMKYSSAIKRNKPGMYPTTWMDLKSIMLCERSQTYNTTYYMIPFT